MTKCPNCSSSASDSDIFCNNCGHRIFRINELDQYLGQAIKVMRKNPSILIPCILLSLMKFIPTILVLKIFGRQKIIEYYAHLQSTTETSSYSSIFLVIMVGVLFTYVLNITFSPFLTNLYLQMIQGDSINFQESYEKIRPQARKFTKAQLILVGIGLTSLIPIGIISFLLKTESSRIITSVAGAGLLLYLFALFYILNAISFSLPIMIIENKEIFEAIVISITFFRDYFWYIGGFVSALGVLKLIIGVLPLSEYYAEVTEIFSSLVLIEFYISSRRPSEVSNS